MDSLPDGLLVPLHPPLAVHSVASVDVHANVAAPPAVTDAGVADKLTVGTGGGVTVTVALASMLPPGPVQDKV